MDISPFATSPCDGLVASRRGLRHGARLVPLCGIPMYLVEQASESKTLHQSQAESLSLSAGATDVFRHKLESLAEREFRSECISGSGRVLSLAVSLGLVDWLLA